MRIRNVLWRDIVLYAEGWLLKDESNGVNLFNYPTSIEYKMDVVSEFSRINLFHVFSIQKRIFYSMSFLAKKICETDPKTCNKKGTFSHFTLIRFPRTLFDFLLRRRRRPLCEQIVLQFTWGLFYRFQQDKMPPSR